MTVLAPSPFRNGSKPSTLQRVGRGIRGFMGLTDDARKRQDTEVLPQDYQKPVPPIEEDEQTLVNVVTNRFKRASGARLVHTREWLEATAFRDGNQWVEWRAKTNILQRVIDPEDPYRHFMTCNKVGTYCEHVKSFVTATKPDVSMSPVRPSDPQDVGATAESTDIMAHLDLIHDWQGLITDLVDCTVITGTGFVKHLWDSEEEALVWRRGPAGVTASAAKVGEVRRLVVPSTEIYPDPDGRKPEEWGWLIHRKRRSLEYLKKKFGERGSWVEPESVNADDGYVDMRLDAIAGDTISGAGEGTVRSAYLYEMWELPTPGMYPKGRLIYVAGGRLMSPKTDWPYDKRDSFPFVPVRFRKRYESAWGIGLVHGLIDLQRQYNTILSRANDRINTECIHLLVPAESFINTDSFHGRANMIKTTYEGSTPPTMMLPPAVGADTFSMLGMLDSQMQEIAGVHDVSQAQTSGGVESGTAIELLQQRDVSLHAGFFQDLEGMNQESAIWCLALARQKYNEPRLIATGTGTEQDSQVAAHDFRALSAGGQVRVRTIPGSAIGKSPAARDAKLMSMAQAGMFSPQQLPATIQLLQLMQLDRDDSFIRNLTTAAEHMEQIAAQAAAQPAAIAAQAEEQKAAAQQADHQNAIAVQTLKGQQGVALEQQKGIQQGQLLQLEDENELHASELDKKNPPVSLALTGKADVPAIQSGERAIGLEAGSDAETKEAQAPPPQLDPNQTLKTAASVQTSRESTSAQQQMHSESTQAQRDNAAMAVKQKAKP